MNHCIECGRKVNAGQTALCNHDNVRCLICRTAQTMRGWRFETAAMKIRRIARQTSQDGTSATIAQTRDR